MREVSHMLKAIHAQENRAAAETKARAVADLLRRQRLGRAAELVDAHVAETLTYYGFPDSHWIKLRTTDVFDKTFPATGAIFSRRRRAGTFSCRR
jgi:putative transposase